LLRIWRAREKCEGIGAGELDIEIVNVDAARVEGGAEVGEGVVDGAAGFGGSDLEAGGEAAARSGPTGPVKCDSDFDVPEGCGLEAQGDFDGLAGGVGLRGRGAEAAGELGG